MVLVPVLFVIPLIPVPIRVFIRISVFVFIISVFAFVIFIPSVVRFCPPAILPIHFPVWFCVIVDNLHVVGAVACTISPVFCLGHVGTLTSIRPAWRPVIASTISKFVQLLYAIALGPPTRHVPCVGIVFRVALCNLRHAWLWLLPVRGLDGRERSKLASIRITGVLHTSDND